MDAGQETLPATSTAVVAVRQEVPEVLIHHVIRFASAEDFVVFATITDKSTEHGFQAARIVPDLIGTKTFATFETFRVALQCPEQWLFVAKLLKREWYAVFL